MCGEGGIVDECTLATQNRDFQESYSSHLCIPPLDFFPPSIEGVMNTYVARQNTSSNK